MHRHRIPSGPPAHSAVLTVDGAFLDVSPGGEQILGYSAAALRHRPFLDLVHPEDYTQAAEVLHTWADGATNRLFVCRMQGNDGLYRRLAWVASPDREANLLYVSVHDATTLLQDQARLAAIVASSDDAIIGKTLDGVIQTWNTGAERLYGYAAKEMIGTSISVLAPTDRLDEVPQLLAQIRRGEPVAHFDTVRVRKDGSLVDVSLSISPLRDEHGILTGAATIARDISEGVRLRRETERARAAAEELARVRGDFVAAVSHELLTPLTAIIGFGQLLEEHWASMSESARRERIAAMVRAAFRQKHLVDELLAIARGQKARPAPQYGAQRLAELLEQAVAEVQAGFPEQDILLHGSAEVRVWADTDHAVEILTNLLNNAAKYSPEGKPVAAAWAQEGSQVTVRIRDQGPGIPERGREVLFTQFGRMEGSQMRAGQVGTGLGLYVSRGLAEAMGGSLDLETTGPEGSTFRLRLPATATPA